MIEKGLWKGEGNWMLQARQILEMESKYPKDEETPLTTELNRIKLKSSFRIVRPDHD
jgi:hypothetical protein